MTYHPDRTDCSADFSPSARKFEKYIKKYQKDEPYICKKCDRVWQPTGEYKWLSEYSIGFPKYGCTKQICIQCNERGRK